MVKNFYSKKPITYGVMNYPLDEDYREKAEIIIISGHALHELILPKKYDDSIDHELPTERVLVNTSIQRYLQSLEERKVWGSIELLRRDELGNLTSDIVYLYPTTLDGLRVYVTRLSGKKD